MLETLTAIITDASSPGSVFDTVIQRADFKYSVVDKSNHIHRTPFERTLYLDTDTYVARPIDDIFDILDYIDIATGLEKGQPYDIGLSLSVPYRQGRVIAFDQNEQVMELFELWREIYAQQRKK